MESLHLTIKASCLSALLRDVTIVYRDSKITWEFCNLRVAWTSLLGVKYHKKVLMPSPYILAKHIFYIVTLILAIILKCRFYFYSHFIGKKPGIQWSQIIFSRSVTKWFSWDLDVGTQVYRICAFNPYVILPPYMKFSHTHQMHMIWILQVSFKFSVLIKLFISAIYVPGCFGAFDFPSSDTKK